MIISNNELSTKIYAAYSSAISDLGYSAQRLATGFKFANAIDGTAELAQADRFRINRIGTNASLAGMTNATGYASTQDEILSNVGDIIIRMSELSAGAVDSTKTTADRVALNNEFRSLNIEVTALAANSKYNGTSLFGLTTTIRIGIEGTDTVQFSAVNLGNLTFTTLSLLTVANASAALISLKTRAGSLAVLRNKARTHSARVERTIGIAQSYIANVSNAETKIRNLDVAQETSNFTSKQVMVSASQSILAQTNSILQGSMKFFNF